VKSCKEYNNPTINNEKKTNVVFFSDYFMSAEGENVKLG